MCISPDQEPLTERGQYSGLERARIDAWVWACKVGGGGGVDSLGGVGCLDWVSA